jgi:hypothetical protein
MPPKQKQKEIFQFLNESSPEEDLSSDKEEPLSRSKLGAESTVPEP